jgi:hypothetical protein
MQRGGSWIALCFEELVKPGESSPPQAAMNRFRLARQRRCR